ncbi:MAG: PIN domain-containing protein [Ignisphaera sp.]
MEREGSRKVVIDTYTPLAIAYDEVGNSVRNVLEGIRRGDIDGLIPATVLYEYVVHWLRERIPGLKNIDELVTYLRSYFKIVELDLNDYIKAAKIKIEGDKMLAEAEDVTLRSRRLGMVDPAVIAVAHKVKSTIATVWA